MTATPAAVSSARFSAQIRSQALQTRIMELILERGLDVGDALPTESELSAELGVGRNTVRESLKVLQALGVIEIRHGFGMFVAPNNFSALVSGLTFRGRLSLRHKGEEAMELIDVRQALESGLVGSAIDLLTDEHLADLRSTMQAMEDAAAKGESLVEHDAEFHRRLYAPLNNELLINLMDVFWQVYRQIHEALGSGPVNLEEQARIHWEIYEAVEARDKALASERLQRHFDGIRLKLKDVAAA
ncbi:FadR/GntR family transcriptional regulator [Pseudarthrobacter sp. SL88]|uniref:GntR domain protein n=2 Tax=Pseudarthrobacter TaxID=1742993 RepID=B8HH72_PSECP|nr:MULTISPECIES: FadR/GntR family transcriptional regulator [Pseudarthrobacter]ACL41363.1 GntR domain protein [Pseudarthrobacter chlorophenolicus A6]MCT9626652.1 FadR family transcriptional regulator [Pseudarthrobacter equi]MCY1673390.1 FadR/GntR family transcriptional regulator [Pseudarthrobacter sp. SL88]SDQ65458.1 DNA-binding transcriptional regulator, FadR family [Pseudarthrobacter chlorophenolicus]SDT59947.1 DNA-binding transcriptional regulator, FadR family [Pseudarthrobacter equi]